MHSIKTIYNIGPGPSSSHTIGPYRCAKHFLKCLLRNNIRFDRIKVTLYGSLAFTGKGHGTDAIIQKVFQDYKCEIILDLKTVPSHPNQLTCESYKERSKTKSLTYYSIGGGDILCNDNSIKLDRIYPYKSVEEVEELLKKDNATSFLPLILKHEDDKFYLYLDKVINTMFESIERGLSKEGYVINKPELSVEREAKKIFKEANKCSDNNTKKSLLLCAFAYAVCEENATGNIIVTAPTCGSAGIIPAILYYEHKYNNRTIDDLKRGLAVAGFLGNFVKRNATVAGSVGGCQAEVGTASAMAAGMLAEMDNLSIHQITYAAEAALEHFLGLTCDPVGGYVVVPCIERNAVAVAHSYICYDLAKSIGRKRSNKVSFDKVVEAMKITGDSLSSDYKETSIGGLASLFNKHNCD